MSELKPCPFCGSTNVNLRAGLMWNGAVHCEDCSADVVFDAVRLISEGDPDWETAVTRGWNRRAISRPEIVPEPTTDSRSCETCRFSAPGIHTFEDGWASDLYCTAFCRWRGNMRVCNGWMGKETKDAENT